MFTRLELVYLDESRKRHYFSRETVPGGLRLELENNPSRFKRGQQLRVELRCAAPLELVDFRAELHPGLDASETVLVNGFQSWSRSGEMGPGDRLPSLFTPARPALAPAGDYRLHRYAGRRGRFHSWTYTFFSLAGEEALFFGSLDEKPGYTLFEYDYGRDRLLIRRDCAGAAAEDGFPLLNIYLGRGCLEAILEEYFAALGAARRPVTRATGWAGHAGAAEAPRAETVDSCLRELARRELPLDIFHIGAGWQSALGDWLEETEKFPAGMKAAADRIREHGFRPGLWLAPFICERGSRVYQENPGWLLRNRRGKPVKAGSNPLWNGAFYALDFYAPGCQDYLSRVFQVAQEEWGFDLLELDYLYAAALLPRQGKSRGRVMTEVMEFIHAQTRKSKILGSGVPLGPALGRLDYCRVGSPAVPCWESFRDSVRHYRESTAASNSLDGVIGRRHLDRRAFRNSPGAFYLGDGAPGEAKNRLTAHQRYTLFFLNNLLGGLVFCADDTARYTGRELALLRSSFPGLETTIRSLERDGDLRRIEFTAARRSYLALANLGASPLDVTLADGPYFHPRLFVLFPGSTVHLEPYQTICLYRVEPREEKPYLLGSTAHIYPGAQVEKLIVRRRSVTLELHRHASPESKIFLAVPRGVINLQVNKVNYPVTLKNRVHFITVPFEGQATPGAPGS